MTKELTLKDKQRKDIEELIINIMEEEGVDPSDEKGLQVLEIAPIYVRGVYETFATVENLKSILENIHEYRDLDFFVEVHKDNHENITFEEMQDMFNYSIFVQGDNNKELGEDFFDNFGLSNMHYSDKEEVLRQLGLYIDFEDYWLDIAWECQVITVDGGAYILS